MKWLVVLGIGEEGLAGLSPVARALFEQAEVLVGGRRHLAMLPTADQRQRLLWGTPIQDSVNQILQWRGRAVCVLASGDPMWYGIGTTLLRQIPLDELTILPSLSAFSLACARLGWSLTEVETLSLCGRDPNLIQALIYPGARLLVLSENRQTPARVAEILTARGFGRSAVTVLEQMGGSQERIVTGEAATGLEVEADLNTLAIDCVADPEAQFFSRLAGLPDSAYQHDGQLTKREVRAVTLAALAPLPGALLWDVGAGCGSIGIEWLRSHARCRAIAIEQHPARLQYIAANAAALGVPTLQIVAGKAPDALQDLPQPDAIFIGGGLTTLGLLDRCWQALRSGGRLVVNAVTVESEHLVFQQLQQWGGCLSRIVVQRAEPVGSFWGWKAMAPITQWVAQKP
ncbi:MAG: precorrin-6y C5,15-methyltransferase (decarboxylating) subunit CbiE [Elainella sp.]